MLLGLATVAPANADGPGPEFKLLTDADDTFTSPDHQVRRSGHEFSSATSKPLGDLAWDYFFGLPVSKKLHRDPKERDSLNHVQAVLIQGLENNYA